MEQFIKFEDALEKLGISHDRLNQLRESGELRAYRDGGSWKFRGDEIERLLTDGIPEPSPPSDIGLVDDSELEPAAPIDSLDDDSDLKLADDDSLDMEASGPDLASEESGEKVEEKPSGADKKASESSDLDLAALDDDDISGKSDSSPTGELPIEGSDSILLSEEELGESAPAPASTIIGKDQLALDDADLELATDDDGSEISLGSGSGASDVLSSGIADSGVLNELTEESGGSSAFEGLEELDIDLEAESSRIITPEEAAKTTSTDTSAVDSDSDLTLDSDLKLEDDEEGTDPVPEALELELSDEGTDPVPEDAELELELAPSDSSVGDSDIDLAGDSGSDFVLADGSGSDVTLNSGDSGINLSPSDSGLALDDIPLEMGGSAILSSLSLGGESDPDISLVASDVAQPSGKSQQAELQEDQDFALTPLSEGGADEDPDSSSQVIALDAGIEDLQSGEPSVLGSGVFDEAGDDGVLLTDDDEMPMEDFGVASYAATGATATRSETDYGVFQIVSLAACAMMSMLAVVMLTDMIRNIWSWNETTSLNSSLLDALLGMFGLR